jgi:amidase
MAAIENIDLDADEAEPLRDGVAAIVEAAARAEQLEKFVLPVKYPARDAGRRPNVGEDEYNAVITFCHVTGSHEGPLSGKSIGCKDNISVAGVPTTDGSKLQSYVPVCDATVVERLLDAGGVITAKLNMDDMAGGATGETSAYGPARNPANPAHSAGGSSGGSGAAVRAGIVDIALGVDQGGSGRIPAAFCGVVCMKATHGLVPSFGVTHIDHTIDFVTPMARSVHDVAVTLEAIGGEDWRDPQWVRGAIGSAHYAGARTQGIRGLRVGLIRESVEAVDCAPAVCKGLDAARSALQDAGASVEVMSIPMWAHGFTIFQPYVAHLVANMIRSEGEGYGHLGYIDADRMHAFAARRRAESFNMNPVVKCWIIADRWLHERFLNQSYGNLHNLRLLLRRRVTSALEAFDLLLTPTVPMTAPLLAEGELTCGQLLERTPATVAANTCQLNLTGHPALSLPSGSSPHPEQLPVAVQLIGRHFDETTVFRAAFAVEERLGPRT